MSIKLGLPNLKSLKAVRFGENDEFWGADSCDLKMPSIS